LKCAQGELESKEILDQSLTKEMGAIPKALGQDGPGELSRSVCVCVSPDESKPVLEFWVNSHSKKAFLRSRMVKWVVVLGTKEGRV
jgi:hypothetical protein